MIQLKCNIYIQLFTYSTIEFKWKLYIIEIYVCQPEFV